MKPSVKYCSFLFFVSLSSRLFSETVITNYVYIISNNFIHTYHENVITQKIKNTHYNYFYTNYLQDVVYQTTVNMQTNINVSETLDVSRDVLIQASNSVLSALGYANNASDYAQSSAQSANNSSIYSSRSATSAANSQTIYNNVVNYGDTTINAMNQKQQWFDDNYGKLITNITYSTNVYYDIDYTARALATNRFESVSYSSTTVDNFKVSIDNSPYKIIGGSDFVCSHRLGRNGYNFNFTFILPINYIVNDSSTYTIHLKPSNRYIRNTSGYVSATCDILDCYWQNGYWYITEYLQIFTTTGSLESWHKTISKAYDPELSGTLNTAETVVSYTHSGSGEYSWWSGVRFRNITQDTNIKKYDAYVSSTLFIDKLTSISNWIEQTFQKK